MKIILDLFDEKDLLLAWKVFLYFLLLIYLLNGHKILAVEYGIDNDVAEVLSHLQYRLHNCILHILHIAAHLQQSTMSSFRVVVDLVCVGSLSSYVVTGDQAGDSQDVHIGALGGTGPTSKPHQTLNYLTKTSPTIHFIT